eukprot:jgi/Hompol1/7030/HPOL_002403-RA
MRAGSKLFIGTLDGAILAYEVEDEPSFTITLIEVSKNFSKRPIDDLAVLPKSRSLVVLSDSTLVVCDSGTLSVTSPMPKTRGCLALKACRPSAQDSQPSTNDMFAAIVRRSVIVFAVSQYEVIQLKEIQLSTVPASLVWIEQNKLIAPTNIGASVIDLQDGSVRNTLAIKDLPMNDGREPKIAAKTQQPYIFTDGADGTFFVTVHTLISCQIEVRSIKTGQILQLIDLPESSKLLPGQLLFASSTNNVWRLLPLDFEDQIDELVCAARFEDALAFIDELEFTSEEDKTSNTVKVRALQAYHMFSTKLMYDEALSILESLNASPLDVLDLFPSLLDDEAEWPIPVSDRAALHALSGYLSRERARLARYRAKLKRSAAKSASLAGFNAEQETLDFADACNLSKLVDTSLLKVYLLLNSPLLGSLVRVDNFCDLITTQRLLTLSKKFDVLVDYFFAKKLHQEALDMLQKYSGADELENRVATYLKRLKLAASADLIFDNAKQVILRNPEIGLSIFTELDHEAPTEIRMKIFEFIESISPSLGMQYLEHVVFELGDTSRHFHNALVFAHISLFSIITDVSEKTTIQNKLVALLEASKHYDAEAVLLRLPENASSQVFTIMFEFLMAASDRSDEENMSFLTLNANKINLSIAQAVRISDENMCRLCLKRISTAMFTHFVDGSLAHTFCVQRAQ